MKKFIKLIILVVVFTIIGGINAEAAKKITTNRNNVSMKVGETKKIKVNVKNVKVKSSKIVKVTVKGKVVSIKGVKAGKAKVKFTAKKMKSKTVKITVKKVKSLKSKKAEAKENENKNKKKDNKKETEESIKEKINGYGNPYKNDIKSYPYLDKTSFGKLDEDTKTIQNKLWQAMPDYLRDCLAYNKTTITYVSSINGGYSGYATYYNNKGDILIKNNNENMALIHEAAHIYDYFNRDFNIDVKNNVKNDFNNNPNKYSDYGSTNLEEFYAEYISLSILKNIVFLNDSEIIDKIVKNARIKESDGKMDITSSIYPFRSITVGGVIYVNGTTYNEFKNHAKNLAKDYYSKIYSNLGYIFIGCI